MKHTPLTVILPTYNEVDNILPLIRDIEKHVNPTRIIVVDDNSPDGTARYIQKKRMKHVDVIVNKPRLGLTPSIQLGIDVAATEYIAWMDADFSHPPELLKKMYKSVKQKDIVVGSWLTRGGKDERQEVGTRIYSYLINKTCQLLFGDTVTAYTSGYIMMKRSVRTDLRLRGDYGEYCIDLLVRAMWSKKRIVEVPFVCVSRTHGESKTAPSLGTFISRSWNYGTTILRLILERANTYG